MRTLLLATLLFLPIQPVPPPGETPATIVRRHDRPDADYLALGRRFPQVAVLGGGLADGTLIGDHWVLTAAHVARGMMRRGRPAVTIEGREFTAAAFFVHPAFRPMGPHDIALIRLDRPVTHVTPLPLYTGQGEAGQIATLVGHGATGVGSDAIRTEDRMRRGATNVVEIADSLYLVFRFDAPPGGTELEGIPGAGDSGGPALIELDGRLVVAGVSSAGRPGPNGPGSYGAMDYFTRVATHHEWIARVLAGEVAPTTESDDGDRRVVRVSPGESSTTLPDTPTGRAMERLLALIESRPDRAAVAAFLRAHTVASGLPDAEFDRRVGVWQRMVEEFAGATMIGIGMQPDNGLDVIVQTAAGRRLLGIRVEPGTGQIRDLLTGRP